MTAPGMGTRHKQKGHSPQLTRHGTARIRPCQPKHDNVFSPILQKRIVPQASGGWHLVSEKQSARAKWRGTKKHCFLAMAYFQSAQAMLNGKLQTKRWAPYTNHRHNGHDAGNAGCRALQFANQMAHPGVEPVIAERCR